jgi:hypothetical protein
MDNRRKITLICVYCKNEYLKAQSEFKRNEKIGRLSFCSKRCAISYQCLNKEYHLLKYSGNISYMKNSKKPRNVKDEYSPFRDFVRRANKRKHFVDIDVIYLKELWESQEGKCPYTKIKLEFTSNINNNFYSSPSLDRIDSSKGYIKGNVQFVSMPINYMKHTMSDNETKQYLDIIINNSNL